MSIVVPAVKQNVITMLAATPILVGRRSQANDIKPMMANTKPRKVRKTQREWHRDKSSVGGSLWKGPTCTKRGLKDTIWSKRLGGALARPWEKPLREPAREVGEAIFSGSELKDVGESTISGSTSSSSSSAIVSLYPTRKKAPRKDITAVKKN